MARIGSKVLVVIVALAVSVSVAACEGTSHGADGDAGGSALANRLSALPGVADAAADREEVEDGVTGTVVGVDLDDDVTADQLSAVLTAINRADPDMFTINLAAGTTDWVDTADRIEGRSDDSGRPAADLLAAAFLTAAHDYPDATVVMGSTGTDIQVDSTDPHDLTPLLEQAAGNTILATIPHLSLKLSNGDTGSSLPGVVTAEQGGALTSADVNLWRGLVAALDRNPDVPPVSLSLEKHARSTDVRLEIQLPGRVPPADLTTQKYGDLLWPLIHGHLDLIADLPPGSTYTLENEYQRTKQVVPSPDPLIDITVGGPAAKDEHGRTWNRDAARYLAD